jgi:8-oxo-dGTP diphosphatase
MELPTHYLITPTPDRDDEFIAALERSLQAGTRLVQFRHKGLEPDDYATLAQRVIASVHHHGGKVLLSGDPALVERLGADGLHLDSKALRAADTRPVPDNLLLAVSGHTLDALLHGQAVGADFAVLSPVRFTKAHPDIEPLGWEGLAAVAGRLNIPVYALGGVDATDEQQALHAGAAGIAGNRGYWKAPAA